MEGTVERFIIQSTEADSLETLIGSFKTAQSDLGFEHFAYGGLGLPASDWSYPDLPPAIVIDYPDEWITHYRERDYLHKDPVVLKAPLSSQEYSWSELGKLGDVEKRVMGESHDAGLAVGLTVPIHGVRGAVHIVSFAGSQQKAVPLDSAARSVLRLLALQFHAAYEALGSSHDKNHWHAGLTPREREVLLWAARGKSSWEIAQILRMSEHTARFHTKNAMQKLDAGSKILAVVKAIRLGLIDP